MAKKTELEQRTLFINATNHLATATELLREAEGMRYCASPEPDKARALIRAAQILAEYACEELKEEAEE